MKKDYEPFGKEWEREMMKFSKEHLVGVLKDALKQVISNDEAWGRWIPESTSRSL